MGSDTRFDMSEAKRIFFVESQEMLDTMENCLLLMEKNPEDAESINAVFRAVHSIKGSSGMFSFDAIESFTHGIENLLDRVRNNEMAVTTV